MLSLLHRLDPDVIVVHVKKNYHLSLSLRKSTHHFFSLKKSAHHLHSGLVKLLTLQLELIVYQHTQCCKNWKEAGSHKTMSTNMCSYFASSCPPPGLIGHLFCIVINFLFEWHLRWQSTKVKVRHWTMLKYICRLPSFPMAYICRLWSAICCYLTGHKQCKHQDFQQPGSRWINAKCGI